MSFYLKFSHFIHFMFLLRYPQILFTFFECFFLQMEVNHLEMKKKTINES